MKNSLQSFQKRGLQIPSISVVEKVLAEKYFDHYVRQAWHIVEPKKALRWNWHLDAICEHLQAVSDGYIQYLMMNIPPRYTKSLTVCVMWPTWEWGPRNTPEMRYVTSSYSQDLSTRDAVKSRMIMRSNWYQQRWGDNFLITGDQNQKTRYINNKTGFRIATSVRGVGTGEGGDRIIVDDPHNVKQAESEKIRKETLTWWDETMASRLDDEDTGAFVLIGQRTHHGDLFGHLMDKVDMGDIRNLVKLIIPARYEKEREKKLQTKTPLEYEDPRTEEMQVLDEGRYPDRQLKKLEGRMTEYARAGQLQQRPSPRGGGTFKVGELVVIKKMPHVVRFVEGIRYWDKAGTDGGGKRTAGVLIFKMKNILIDFLIIDVVKGQWSYGKRERRIKQTAIIDAARDKLGELIKVYVEQEPGSGGKESAESSVKNLAGFRVGIDRPTGNKELRWEPFADQIENGNVGVLFAEWLPEFISELEGAPTGLFKDQCDAAAGGFNLLHAKKKKGGVWGR